MPIGFGVKWKLGNIPGIQKHTHRDKENNSLHRNVKSSLNANPSDNISHKRREKWVWSISQLGVADLSKVVYFIRQIVR